MSTKDPIKNAAGKTVATVRQVGPGFFELQRLTHRGDEYVNLGAVFSHGDVFEVRQWAHNWSAVPKWDDWQKLPAYRRARAKKRA